MKATGNKGLRLLCLGLCLLCMVQMILPASAAVKDAEQAEVFYTSKVYYKANANSFVIGNFEDGMALTVLGESGDYYKVDCYDMDGYIAKSQVRFDGEKYYVNCDRSSPDTDSMEYVSLNQAMSLRAEVLATAKSKLGCRYRHGCGGPNLFDCSGFTSYVYEQSGYDLYRGSQMQLEDGVIISLEGLQVGDLLFYKGTHRRTYVSHVAMYAGDGKMIHADSRGVIITDLDDSYYASRFVCARRVINISAAQIEEVAAPTAQSVLTRTSSTGLR